MPLHGFRSFLAFGSDNPPVWETVGGSLGGVYTTRGYNFVVTATNTASYSIISGSLPGGMSLDALGGSISGIVSGIADYASNVVYSFTIRATSPGGNFSDRSFSISGNSILVGITCATANEGGTASATVPSGFIIRRIDFVSYGTPNGGCGSYTLGSCHAGYDLSSRIGTNSFSLGANNATFGDPCGGTAKRLYIQVSHGPI